MCPEANPRQAEGGVMKCTSICQELKKTTWWRSRFLGSSVIVAQIDAVDSIESVCRIADGSSKCADSVLVSTLRDDTGSGRQSNRRFNAD